MSPEFVLELFGVVEDSSNVGFGELRAFLSSCQSQSTGHDVPDLASVEPFSGDVVVEPGANVFPVMDQTFIGDWFQETLENCHGLVLVEVIVFDSNMDAGLDGDVELSYLISCEEENSYKAISTVNVNGGEYPTCLGNTQAHGGRLYKSAPLEAERSTAHTRN